MQKVNNMGSLLQSYGLKRILETVGCEVEYIDIKRIDKDYDLLGSYTQDFSQEFGKTGFWGKISRIDKYLLNRLKYRKLVIEQNNLFEKFRLEKLNIDRKSEKYDLCVIGSDEVFNCLNSGYWGFTSQLFGNVPEAKRVITYAASCGTTKYEDLPDEIADRIRESFKKISTFSVRDKNTLYFVRNLSDNQVSENFDPVLIYDFDNEIEQEDLIKIPQRYCIVYSYRNRIHNNNEISEIKNFCRVHKLTPIAVGSAQFWIENFIVCSPFQCLKLFKNANFVITDTFHGTIFAAKYTNKFAVLIRDSNRNKLGDLIERLGIKDHLINNMEELDIVYQTEKDANSIYQIIGREYSRSLEYLKGNI
ncbi:MAG: polysaccharide pyruvyl transferase family protein [Hungatella sp.]|nr:polysaccharide pyruvyl transferase family protein [Hungatella sp.]